MSHAYTKMVIFLSAAAFFLGPPVNRVQAREARPIRALLVAGGCCHEYAKQKDVLTKGISERANVSWAVSYDPDKGTQHKNPAYDSADWAKSFDVIVHDECTADVKDPDAINRVLEPHRKGLPAVVLHCGMHSYRSEGFPQSTPWFQLTGLATTKHGAMLPIDITFVDKKSPITKSFENWTTVKEELYNNFSGDLLGTASALARGKQVSKDASGAEKVDDTIVAWTNTYGGKTRVFATTLGHTTDTVSDARYLDLVTRGLLWSVNKLDKAHLKPAAQVMLDGK